MAYSFPSKLNQEVNYDFEFNEQDVKNEDKQLKTLIYKINIFGNLHYIAMGNKQTHVVDNKITYYPVYLVYKDKVITKVGVYELMGETIEENPNFEDFDLNLHPKYYNPPFVLDQFIVDDDVYDEEEKTEDTVVGITNALKTKDSIVLQDGSLDLNVSTNLKESYDLIKELTNNGKILTKETSRVVRDILRFLDVSIIETSIDESMAKEYKDLVINLKRSTLKNITDKKTSKKVVTFVLNLVIANYISSNDKFAYSINLPLLFIIEIITGTKFIILDKDNKMFSFGIFGDNFKIEPDIEEYRKLFVGKNEKTKEDYNRRFEEVNNNYLGYDPDKIVFMRVINKKFFVMKRNDKVIFNITELDDKLMNLIRTQMENTVHEYSIETQLSGLKDILSRIPEEGNNNSNINNSNNDDSDSEEEKEEDDSNSNSNNNSNDSDEEDDSNSNSNSKSNDDSNNSSKSNDDSSDEEEESKKEESKSKQLTMAEQIKLKREKQANTKVKIKVSS